MPHIGRTYPFHPTYWATEAWFWPGFLPWKTRWFCGFSLVHPWNSIQQIQYATSEPGVTADENREISYNVPILLIVGTGTCRLLFRKEIESGVRYAYCRAYFDLGAIGNYEAWSRMIYPQRQVLVDAWAGAKNTDTGVDVFIPPVSVTEATYAEGGSPWHHPTGGGVPLH